MAQNNYDQWREDWRLRFLSLDKEELLRKLPFLTIRDGQLLVPYLGETCPISLETGRIQAPEAWGSLGLYDEMNIYTLLWYAKDTAMLSGVWLPFEQLKSAGPYGPAFRNGNLKPFAATFTGHGEALRQVLLAHGGQKLRTGDVGYQIDVFPCIPMQVLFWEGDEEFPAQVNLLFDRSTPDFIHVESVVTIASEALEHLAREAGLPVAGGAL